MVREDQDRGEQLKGQMAAVRGIQDLAIFYELGRPNVLVEVDRSRSARYGLAAGDVNAVVQAAIGGQQATQIFEGERLFPLVVRLLPQYREVFVVRTFGSPRGPEQPTVERMIHPV